MISLLSSNSYNYCGFFKMHVKKNWLFFSSQDNENMAINPLIVLRGLSLIRSSNTVIIGQQVFIIPFRKRIHLLYLLPLKYFRDQFLSGQ